VGPASSAAVEILRHATRIGAAPYSAPYTLPRVLARPRTIALLLVAGAAISAATMLHGIDPFDEGFLLASVDRIGRGQVPYADFTWPYGPGHPYLLAGVNEIFGRSLVAWRVVRVLCDTGVAALVYVIARRALPPGWALAAWLCAACAMAQPVSANPFPVAMLAGLAALALVTRPERGRWDWAWAGLLTGVAAAWRLDFALYAGAAVGVALLLGPPGRRLAPAAGFAGVAVLTGLVAYGPFIVDVGPGHLYQALVGDSSRERDWWTLPFPVHYHGSLRAWPPGALATDAKHVLGFYVPLLVVVGLALAGAACAAARRGRAVAVQAAAVVLGLGALLYLLSRTDEFHANPGIVALALALPLGVVTLWRGPAWARALAVPMALVFALLTLYGVANRLSAVFRPLPAEPLHLAVAHGVRARPTDARALPAVVRTVQRLVPPGQPIYAATRRSDIVRYNDPLLYVLVDRPNVLDRDVGLFARPGAQREIVARLRSRRPRAVVRWTDPISARREPNLRGHPSPSHALDSYLARAYRPVLRRGYYVVLVPRRSRTRSARASSATAASSTTIGSAPARKRVKP
jgi:FtsH-binding integral membrane protein